MNLTITLSRSRLYRIAVSGFFFIAGITFATWASRIPDIKTSLQLSDAALGGVLLALPLGLMMSLPISGWLITKYGSRKMLITGALFYPFLLLVLGIAATLWQLIGGLFLFGLLDNTPVKIIYNAVPITAPTTSNTTMARNQNII